MEKRQNRSQGRRYLLLLGAHDELLSVSLYTFKQCSQYRQLALERLTHDLHAPETIPHLM